MISRKNYGEDHIRELQDASRRDPILIERTLFAFGMLEALVKVGLDFTFKGGTSLMLLLSKPMRLSTDIDIVVKPGTDVNAYIKKASEIFPFRSGEEHERKSKGKLEKRHFKFIYDSPVHSGDSLYVLLDILFEENNYERIVEKEIANDLLLTDGENLRVRIPSADCILGDKMTAFAPHTTGIPLGENKDMEVMKQFYDVSTLIDEFKDFECLRKTYFRVASTEIAYRECKIKPEDALMDTVRTAMCIGSRGKVCSEDFPFLLNGTREVTHHIYEPGFSMEQASVMAPKVICIAACLLTGTPFELVTNPELYKQEDLIGSEIKKLRNIRKMKSADYAYLVIADRLLEGYQRKE